MGRISPDDARAWRRAVRDVAPLPGRTAASEAAADPVRPRPDPSPPAKEPRGALTVRHSGAGAQPQPAPPLDRFAGVDRATAERVRRGRYPVDASLDLHGMRQDEAHRALARFVAASRAAGRRCVLVITGHGRSSGGVLKAAVPRWLDEPPLRPHVLAIAPARLKDGGSGALYLLLRRLPR